MSKIFRIFSQNKKILPLGLFLVLFFSFLPIQGTNLTSVSAQTYNSNFYCVPNGPNFFCSGTLPADACVAIGNGKNNCVTRCNAAGGTGARLGEPPPAGSVTWYCCNHLTIMTNTTCGPSNTLPLNAAPSTVDLTAGNPTIPPPATGGFTWPWDWIGDTAQILKNFGINLLQFLTLGIWVAALTVIVYVLLVIFGAISGLIGPVLGWIMQATLSIPVAPAAPNVANIVTVGWNFTRDLMNMFFILILVFVGLATILRLQSYELKKTLPLLVVMVLLVNFSGVIVGTIVDISNLVTNFFVSGINMWDFSFSTIGNTAIALGGQLLGLLTHISGEPGEYISSFVQPFGQIAAIAFFFVILDFMLFAIMLIFLIRTIMLWIIVILAPIAFTSYILPSTRSFWSWWWKNLIQWSIVGIPISFFLYLSVMVIRGANSLTAGFGTPGVDSQWLGSLIVSLLSPITVIILLFVGIGLSLAGAPASAKGLMEWGKKATVSTGKWVGKSMRESGAINKTEGFFRKRLESAPGFNRVPGLRRGDWEIEKNRRIEAAKKNIIALPDTEEGNKAIAQRITQLGAPKEQIIQGIDTLAQRKELDKVENSKLIAMLKKVSSESNFNAKNVYKAAPHLAPYLGFQYKDAAGAVIPDPIATRTPAARDIATAVERINPGDLSKDVMKKTLEDRLVVANILADARKVTNMGRNLEAEKKRIFRETAMHIPGHIFNNNFTPAQQAAIANNLTEVGGGDPNWQV